MLDIRTKDLTGEIFGKWRVVKFSCYREKACGKKMSYWICECECGEIREVAGYSLTSGKSQSCGCLKKEVAEERVIDIAGNKYNNLTVIKKSENRNNKGEILWICECDCGNIIETTAYKMKSNNTKSCGCLRRRNDIKVTEEIITELPVYLQKGEKE